MSTTLPTAPLAPLLKLNDGKTIPNLGLGFWETPKDSAATLAYDGLKTGYRLLDCAEAYKNESGVIAGIAKWLNEDPANNKREDVFYTTKVATRHLTYEKAKATVARQVKEAESIGYIDLILLHAPIANDENRHGAWKALQEAVAEGKVKNIGVSNYGIKHLKELLAYKDLTIKPAVNQLELHPWLTREELVAFTKAQGITVEAYSPLTRARKLDDEDVQKFAKKYGKSAAQILIRWSLQKGFIPLPKTVHTQRLQPNLDVFDFELTADEVKVLDGKNTNLNFCWEPTVYPLDAEKTDADWKKEKDQEATWEKEEAEEVAAAAAAKST